MYQSTKTFGHNLGLSCCFRQWKATHSHCRFLHGYAIGVKLVFKSSFLDDKNWVVDFGGLKEVEGLLKRLFDHKTLIAQDDPALSSFKALEQAQLIDLVVLKDVGCEKFAETIYHEVIEWLSDSYPDSDRIILASVEVMEHGANSAIYTPEGP